jgi:hypothetical protein
MGRNIASILENEMYSSWSKHVANYGEVWLASCSETAGRRYRQWLWRQRQLFSLWKRNLCFTFVWWMPRLAVSILIVLLAQLDVAFLSFLCYWVGTAVTTVTIHETKNGSW